LPLSLSLRKPEEMSLNNRNRAVSSDFGLNFPQSLAATCACPVSKPDKTSHSCILIPPSVRLRASSSVAMENSSVASASSEAGSTRSQEIEELERFIDSYVLEYQVQGLLNDKNQDEQDQEEEHTPPHTAQWPEDCSDRIEGSWTSSRGRGSSKHRSHVGPAAGEVGFHPVSPESVQRNSQTPAAHRPRGCLCVCRMMKGKLDDAAAEDDDDDGIDLESVEKFLPSLPVFPPLHNEAEIAQTKKLFRRRKNDRRQQRHPGGGGSGGRSQNPPPLQQTNQTQQQPNPDNQSGTKHGGRGFQGQQNQGGRHGYSQNRRWNQQQKHQTSSPTPATRSTKEMENEKCLEPQPCTETGARDEPAKEERRNQEKTESGKICLLQSSKERLRRRLKEKEEVAVAAPGRQQSRTERLLEILSSMKNNSSGVEEQLSGFMMEAQSSAQSEETLQMIVQTVYGKALSDRSFASTAAKLCDKMADFMVEGTKFRSLLLNMLQRDFTRREELRKTDVESWLGFITFLCEVFNTMRSSNGQPFRVLVCPIYSCLRELLDSSEVREDAVLCCSMELQSTGRLLEEQLPEMMTELLAAIRDKMLSPSESQLSRSLLLEIIEIRSHHWSPLEERSQSYYTSTIRKLTA
ncbi:hypothetical protein DNTS_004041, partial [Danionella cerebrum]